MILLEPREDRHVLQVPADHGMLQRRNEPSAAERPSSAAHHWQHVHWSARRGDTEVSPPRAGARRRWSARYSHHARQTPPKGGLCLGTIPTAAALHTLWCHVQSRFNN